jgi:hypothetical protein
MHAAVVQVLDELQPKAAIDMTSIVDKTVKRMGPP